MAYPHSMKPEHWRRPSISNSDLFLISFSHLFLFFSDVEHSFTYTQESYRHRHAIFRCTINRFQSELWWSFFSLSLSFLDSFNSIYNPISINSLLCFSIMTCMQLTICNSCAALNNFSVQYFSDLFYYLEYWMNAKRERKNHHIEMCHSTEVIHSFCDSLIIMRRCLFCVFACGIVVTILQFDRMSFEHVSHILCLRATLIMEIEFIIWLHFSRVFHLVCGLSTIGKHSIHNSGPK